METKLITFHHCLPKGAFSHPPLGGDTQRDGRTTNLALKEPDIAELRARKLRVNLYCSHYNKNKNGNYAR